MWLRLQSRKTDLNSDNGWICSKNTNNKVRKVSDEFLQNYRVDIKVNDISDILKPSVTQKYATLLL